MMMGRVGWVLSAVVCLTIVIINPMHQDDHTTLCCTHYHRRRHLYTQPLYPHSDTPFCHTSYIVCTNGLPTQFTCPNETVWSQSNRTCINVADGPGNCPVCVVNIARYVL